MLNENAVMSVNKLTIGMYFYFYTASVYAVTPEIEKLGELNSPVSLSSVIQVIVGLFIVLIVIAISAFMLKRVGRFSSLDNGILKIVATLAIGTRDRIVLLQAGEQQILIGITPGRINTLCQLEKPIDISEVEMKSSGSFSEKLVSAIKGHSVVKDNK